jgi:hypothetical protein
MGGRYEAIKSNPELVRSLTSLTVEEISELAGPFERAFREHMAEWTLEGKRRKNRSYVTYATKENPTQTYHGQLYGMSQGKANHWIHTLFPPLRKALRTMGDAPERDFASVLQRLEALSPQLPDEAASEQSPSPLLPTTQPNAPSPVPSTSDINGATTAARSASTRSRTSSSSMRRS